MKDTVWSNLTSGVIATAALSTTLCAAIIVFYRRRNTRKIDTCGRKYPPEILSIPIAGSLPFLPDYSRLHEFSCMRSQTMGPVIGFYMGRQYSVIVNGREAIYDALARKADLATRPILYTKSKYFNRNYKGLGECMYDDAFKRYHQVSLNILRDFGFGKRVMETRIRREVDQTIEHISTFKGKAFNPIDIIISGVMNIMTSILFNRRYDINDPDLKRFIELDEIYFSEYYEFMAVDSFQELLYLPRFQRRLEANIIHKAELMQLLAKTMLNAAYNKENGDSFVSCFIEREGLTNYDYEQLLYIVRDMILGGTGTTASAVQWFIIYMANYPNVQELVQREIDSVVGNDREITLDDEKNLPYTQATILELMRRQTVSALGIPHCAMKDTSIMEYFIPQGTLVIVNLYSAHMDPGVWPDPDDFKPERFLDSSGHVVGKERMIAFSMGKRSCTGEQLARQELFLFCASLAQHFKILPPEGRERVTVRERVFLTTTPTAFTARLISRTVDKH